MARVEPFPICIFPEFQLTMQAKTPVPVLVQHGKDNIWQDDADGQHIADWYPNSKYSLYENSGIYPMIEESGKWVAEMRDFCAGEFKKKK